MRIQGVHQETPDVWTLALIPAGDYSYQPGQYALVDIPEADVVRAYTLSSSPGVSPCVTLTVRRLPGGIGSTRLTANVGAGDTLWLSAAQGEFTCAQAVDDRYLLLAGGCGVTPIMSMTRWLMARRPESDVSVIYSVRSPADVIFSDEWRELMQKYPTRLRMHLMTSREAGVGALMGRISREVLETCVPDIALRTVMACGPQNYMDHAAGLSAELGVPAGRFHMERFHTAAECVPAENASVMLTLGQPPRQVAVPAGALLLDALEQHGEPVAAACRAGVCGACKVRVAEGKVLANSQATLTPDEIAQGYVLACSCQMEGDVVLA